MKNKSSLTLLELIIMVMVLALAAALCLRAFVYSKTLSEQDRIKAAAERQAQTAVELLKASKGDLKKTAQKLLEGKDPGQYAIIGDGSLMIYFDTDWQPRTASSSASGFVIKITTETSGLLGKASITVFELNPELIIEPNSKELCTLVSSWQEVAP